MSDCLIIIPTYNEKENIEKIIHYTFNISPRYHILIVDDGSPDGTAEIVKNLISQNYSDRLFILERKGKLGLGTAYITGFRWALEKSYQYICEMDADFSHNPNDLNRLIEACENGAGMSVGSRYVKGGNVKNWPLNRVLMSYFASVYVRLITWIRVKDTTAGFVCYRREVLQSIDLNQIQFVGYAFQIEMKFAVDKGRFKIVEVPITFVDRVEGASKMSTGIFKEAFLGVLVMRRKTFMKPKYYYQKTLPN